MEIKKLQHHGQEFAPRTVAEAVLVKHNTNVVRLDQLLLQKVETISSDEFDINKQGTHVSIAHKNKIPAQETPKLQAVSFDSGGHITGVLPISSLNVVVNNTKYASYDGNQETSINLGDDFEIKNNLIGLHWNHVSS